MVVYRNEIEMRYFMRIHFFKHWESFVSIEWFLYLLDKHSIANIILLYAPTGVSYVELPLLLIHTKCSDVAIDNWIMDILNNLL
jgi:hypothetical protein